MITNDYPPKSYYILYFIRISIGLLSSPSPTPAHLLANIESHTKRRKIKREGIEVAINAMLAGGGRVGKNPGFFKKNQPSGFFGVFLFFFGFLSFFLVFCFFWVFLPRREGF